MKKAGNDMDREILFRAKRVSNGMWVEGDLTRCILVGEAHICRIEDNLSITTHRVDPQTICQYTGLTDKNGRKIFEGDIVKLILLDGEVRYLKVSIKSVERKILCHPDFDDEVSKVEITGIVFEWNEYELFPCTDTYGVTDYKMMEVVGNIFDNPELLEDW